MSVFFASLVVISIAQLAVLVHKGNKVKELTIENVNLKIHNLELYRKTIEQSIQIITQNMQIELQKALVISAELDLKIHEVKIASLKEDLSRVSETMRSSITASTLN